VEIGTSTGHSSIWIAWALSKTGGKLITIEIDERRYREALANFKEAGLSEYIDARLADAHQLVKELPGPFDFVFIDADKDWYTNYAKALIPKLEPGGCLTAHNVRGPASRGGCRSGTEGRESLPPLILLFLHPSDHRGTVSNRGVVRCDVALTLGDLLRFYPIPVQHLRRREDHFTKDVGLPGERLDGLGECDQINLLAQPGELIDRVEKGLVLVMA